jgi:hypothetical protein
MSGALPLPRLGELGDDIKAANILQKCLAGDIQ